MSIDKFEGPNRFLSNFWPCEVRYDGWAYPSVEHAYQAAKFTDPEKRAKIQAATTAQAAKKIGRTKGIRADWDDVKFGIMRDLLQQKFEQGSANATQLLATGDEQLVEGNWWGDTYWGVCKGKGKNHLGNLLMQRRSFLLLLQ